MELNKRNMKNLMILIAFGIGLFWLLDSIPKITSFFFQVLNLLFPFILGGVIAFILNIPMTKIENFIKSKQKNKNLKIPVRVISITLSIVIFIGMILLICFLLIPELIENIQILINNIPTFFENFEKSILDLVKDHPDIQKQVKDTLSDTAKFNDIVVAVLNYMINGSLSFITNLITSLFIFFTAIVFAVYMLNQKEYLQCGIKKIMYAYMKKEYVEKVINLGVLANKTFSKFISGQCVEAIILGTIFFIVLTLFQFPYALIISVLTTITALIPMFGAMIAMIVGALLIAVNNPIQALLFIVVFQVIQQIENNFIYPKVVGKSVGLSSIWSLMAIILSGSLMGIPGMIIGLPLASILYAILREETHEKLEKKKIRL